MSQPQQVSMNIERFVTLSVNMLHKYFFESHKDKAKKLFKEIEDGHKVRVGTLNFGDEKEGEIRVKLMLDHSEYRGHLTFHMFRQALDMVLKRIADRLQKKQDLNVYTSETTREAIVHIPGIAEDRGNINVLVMGISSEKAGEVTVKLQYLDPTQFEKQEPAEGEDNDPG